jgi:hypothetical protein
MSMLHKTQDTDAFDPDAVPWPEEPPAPTKPKAGAFGNGLLPMNSRFITELRRRSLYAKVGRDFDVEAAKPVVPDHLHTTLERQIPPAVNIGVSWG